MSDDLFIQHYLDGELSQHEMEAFEQRLRTNAELREHLRVIAEQAVAFGDLARRETVTSVRSSTETVKGVRFTWLALAASIAVLATSTWLFIASQPAAVLTLVESTGTVERSDGTVVANGENLPAGTLETVGDTSSALLRFEDGSLITLHGDAELSFSSEHQKVLSLTRGTLSAEVRPQPPGRPMLIRTPSAVAEVVGTSFDLSARSEDTALKVNEGLVRLKRLADGSHVDVAANSSAVASLRTDLQLSAEVTPEPLVAWRFDFAESTPPRDWRGIARGGLMHASPYVARKHDDGRVTTHFGVSIRTAMLPQPLQLQATESGVIYYRLRQEQPGGLQLILLTKSTDGSYGGNFECKIGESELQPGSDGWCEVAIPLGRFQPLDRERHGMLAGKLLTSVLLSSYSENRQLAVSHFELKTNP